MRIDLHLHSTASDGSLAPAALVRAAGEGGLHLISVTDHDTLAGVEEAVAAGAGSVEVIAGIELSCHQDGAEIHVLGYFVDRRNPELRAYAERAAQSRRARMRAMLERLETQGISVPFEDVEAAAGPDAHAIGRPHLARTLVDRGFAVTVSDAFDRLIGDASPAFLPTNLIAPHRGIELIHGAGGIAVWAHPRSEIFERDIRRFVAWGLDGVECFRPRADAGGALRLETVSRELGLVVTGGSDWHGPWHGRLGAFCVSADDVAAFLERGGI